MSAMVGFRHFSTLGTIAMHVAIGVVFLLWSAFAESGARTVAEMLRHQRSGAMVTAASDGFLDRRDSDPAIVVGHSGATRNGVDGGPCDAVKPDQLFLNSRGSERREKLSNVRIDGLHAHSLVLITARPG